MWEVCSNQAGELRGRAELGDVAYAKHLTPLQICRYQAEELWA